jgi:hypothetical protein
VRSSRQVEFSKNVYRQTRVDNVRSRQVVYVEDKIVCTGVGVRVANKSLCAELFEFTFFFAQAV